MSKGSTKRNAKTARGQRSGVSPYKRWGKRPCAHCVAITAASRRAAMTGAGGQPDAV